MNYLNDSNWTVRTPRTLSQSKWGTAAKWRGYDNGKMTGDDAWCVACIVCIAVVVLVCMFSGVFDPSNGPM